MNNNQYDPFQAVILGPWDDDAWPFPIAMLFFIDDFGLFDDAHRERWQEICEGVSMATAWCQRRGRNESVFWSSYQCTGPVPMIEALAKRLNREIGPARKRAIKRAEARLAKSAETPS
jgi:hypothetical protein